jgi:ketosteroid isomerase-like protein
MASDMGLATVQKFFLQSFAGNVASAIEFLDRDVSYHVPGSSPIAGNFEGPEAVTQHVSELLQLTNRTVDVLQWEDWMAGINHIAGLVHMSVQRRGALLTFRAVYLVSMSDNQKIRRIEVLFADQVAVERFFAAAFGEEAG